MTKFSFEVKLKAIRMYLAGIGSSTTARKLGISTLIPKILYEGQFAYGKMIIGHL